MFSFFRRPNPNIKQEGNFLLAKVVTSRNKEVIDVRISKSSELSSGQGGYFVRKNLIGSKSLDKATLELNLTRNYGVKVAALDGGEFIPVKEWAAFERQAEEKAEAAAALEAEREAKATAQAEFDAALKAQKDT